VVGCLDKTVTRGLKGIVRACLTRPACCPQLNTAWLVGYWIAQVGAAFLGALLAEGVVEDRMQPSKG
jgi:hypothetical protein